ncbi:D-alanyl-D-alanine carboxypeptidase/D-alanyl-D-alanine-endopeptidase [soil metagenome]
MRVYGGRSAGCFAILLAFMLIGSVETTSAQGAVSSQNALSRAIERIIDAPGVSSGHWGIHIVEAATGTVLYSRNEDRGFVPSSNQKLFTTAVALDLLGPDFRYLTGLYAAGTVSDERLSGDLIIRGSGDPTFGGRFEGGDPMRILRLWADSVAAAGISTVGGDIVYDASIFSGPPYGPGWAWDDIPARYAAEVSGLQFNEGILDLYVRGTQAGRHGVISWTPSVTGLLEIQNQTTTLESGATGRASSTRPLFANTFVVSSTVAPGATVREQVSVHNPAEFFSQALLLSLRERGVSVQGRVRPIEPDEARQYVGAFRVASYRSVRLVDIVEQTNKDSNNVYAEHLIRSVGAYRFQGGGDIGSLDAGFSSAEPFFRRAGVNLEMSRFVDGSGMSFMNMVSPRDVTNLLLHMHRHPDTSVRQAFRSSLPIGGIDGTLRNRYGSGLARDNVRAKTGFITGSRTLSGYVMASGGRMLVFSLLVNQYGVSTSRINAAQDELVEALARYRP